MENRMKIDAVIEPDSLHEVSHTASAAERVGFDGIIVREIKHDPFVLLSLIASSTMGVDLMTGIALAFPRSPTTIAYSAWDIQSLSKGRLILGLGSQVKGHMERRFGVKWENPIQKMREVIEALRAIWRCWQEGVELNFSGKYYRLNLMTGFFNPGPIENPRIPIYIAAVNRGMCALAGEVCDGIHLHPVNSPKYIKEVVLPSVKEGAERAGRSIKDVSLAATILTATGLDEDEVERSEDFVRSQIAFYASTASYRGLFDFYGWGDVADKLVVMSREGRWEGMPRLITDEMLKEFSVVGKPSKIPTLIKARYEGLLSRVALYTPFNPKIGWWQEIVKGFK